MRKAILSAAIVALLVALYVGNLPAGSSLRHRFYPLERVMDAIGLEQGWGVFTHPRINESLRMEAEIHHRDGTVEIYTVPEFGRLLGVYREVRWHKLEEYASLGAGFGAPEASQFVAEWLADRFDAERVVVFKESIIHGSNEPKRSKVYELSL